MLLRPAVVSQRPVGRDESDEFDSFLKNCAGLLISLYLVGPAVKVLSKIRCPTHPNGSWEEYLLECTKGQGVTERADGEQTSDCDKLLRISLQIADWEGEDFLNILQKQQYVPKIVVKRLSGEKDFKWVFNKLESSHIIRVELIEYKTLCIGLHDLVLEFYRERAKQNNTIYTSGRNLLDS